jgi:hypothetical protein
MGLRQGKGGIFTPASAGCAYSIEERIWRALTIALVCSAVSAIYIEYTAEPLGGWDAADKGFFARVTSSDLQRRLSKVPTILTRCQTEFSPERCRQVGLA